MSVIVLNSDYTFLCNVDWKRSIILLYQGKAEVVKETDKVIYNCNKTHSFVVPKVIRLLKYIDMVLKNKVPYSKINVFIRDKYTCQYCGKKLQKSECTVDHIIPKSKGGASKWTNCVTSCKKCNRIKGDRDLDETNFKLLKQPRVPTVYEYFMEKANEVLKNIEL